VHERQRTVVLADYDQQKTTSLVVIAATSPLLGVLANHVLLLCFLTTQGHSTHLFLHTLHMLAYTVSSCQFELFK
jgi:hypothetical protein